MRLHLLRTAAGLAALAVFVLGGLVAPALHGVEHAAEWAEARDSHLAAGHHHHAASETHRAEADAPCPEPLALDLLCVLCQGVSVYVPAAPTALAAPHAQRHHSSAEAQSPLARIAGTHSIRGPPEPVA